MLEAANGSRQLTDAELRHILEHVAQAGFHPQDLETVRGRLTGVPWRGRRLTGVDRLPPAEVKYLWHVLTRQEWPAGTTLLAYLNSIRDVVLDSASGVFTCRYQGIWSLTIVRESGELRGPRGHEWLLVQYRVGRGHWTTAFQLEQGLAELQRPQWSDIRWLRQPTSRSRPSPPSAQSS